MLASSACHGEAERDALLGRRFDEVAGELGAGASRSAGRRGHPHGDRAPSTELAGRAGGTLHTARSRNDQVATDLAMFVREASEAARLRSRR